MKYQLKPIKHRLKESLPYEIAQVVGCLHYGKDNAIKAGEIEQLIGIDDDTRKSHNRQVRIIIKDAIENYDFLIGSCQSGFYLISNGIELEETIDRLRRIVQGTEDRIKKLKELYRTNGHRKPPIQNTTRISKLPAMYERNQSNGN